MAQLRHVILEFKGPSRSQGGLAAGVGPKPSEESIPNIEGFVADQTFPSITVPTSETDGAPLLGAPKETQRRIVRGTISEDRLQEAIEQAEKNSQCTGLFSDEVIAPMVRCIFGLPNGTYRTVEKLLDVERLQKLGMNGSDTMVAIVDTGINMRHLNRRGRHPNFRRELSWVPPTGTGTPGEFPVDHGTMTAFDATIAAPNCTLLDIALFQSKAKGETPYEGLLSDAVLAYAHLLNVIYRQRMRGKPIRLVVNNSWGIYHPSWDFPPGSPGNYSDNPDHPFNRIVGTLARAGADILFAAGNCGPECPDLRCRCVTKNAIYGANSHPQVTCVAGVDVKGKRVGYSTVGPGRLSRRKPDISAYTHFFGSGVFPADGGTSAATPVLAGLMAAIRTRMPARPEDPSTGSEALRNIVTSTADSSAPFGFNFKYGWGVLNGPAVIDEVMKRIGKGTDKTEKETEKAATA